MSLRAIVTALAAVCVLGAPGCVSFGNEVDGAKIDAKAVRKLEIGKTTRTEALALLGAPKDFRRTDYGSLAEALATRFAGDNITMKVDPALYDEIFVYEQVKTKRFLMLFVLFNYWSMPDEVDRLVLFFTPEGILEAYGYTHEIDRD